MTLLRTSALATCALILLSTSCKKDDTADPGSGGGGGAATINKFVLLNASRHSSAHNEGRAFAVFFNIDNTPSSMSVVELSNHVLEELGTGYYSVPIGTYIDLSSGLISWDILGAHDFPSLTHYSGNAAFPSDGTLISTSAIVKSQGYTVEASGFSGADSINVSIDFVVNVQLPAPPPGTNFIHTFTAAELSGLSTGSTTLSVSGTDSHVETQGSTRIQSDATTNLITTITVTN